MHVAISYRHAICLLAESYVNKVDHNMTTAEHAAMIACRKEKIRHKGSDFVMHFTAVEHCDVVSIRQLISFQ